jgi:hypothetical protein
MGRGPSKEERDVMAEINKVLAQEEIWIKQRSRVQWLKAGDKNSAYFHAQVAMRKRTNRISSLRRDDDFCVLRKGKYMKRYIIFINNCTRLKGLQIWMLYCTMSRNMSQMR